MPSPLAPLARRLLVSALLFLGSQLFASTPDLSMLPGSASMPPKPLETPLPTSLKGGRPVRLGAWVDETGKVLKVENLGNKKDTENPAIGTLLKWRFEPVLWEGKAIPFRVDITLSSMGAGLGFNMNPLPNFPCENHVEGEFGLVMPSALVDPEVQIPLEAFVSRAAVEAAFRFVVGTDGIPSEIEILGASSGPSLNAALNALSGQVYRPGTINGQPVRVAYKQIVSVNTTTPVPADLQGLQLAGTPLYPYEQLLASETGSAKVNFTLNADGSVEAVKVLEATQENFGRSLKAAVSSWRFSPEAAALKVEREYSHDFNTDSIPGGLDRLAKLLRKGETISNSSAQLSGKPTRVASGALCYPPELLGEGLDGTAKIEFIIDRCGLAQAPRILEASHPAFGWAAANWVGTMRFKPLQRAGVPTDLRVVFPISFKHPAPAATTASPAAGTPAS